MAKDLHGSVSLHVSEYLDNALKQALKEAKPGGASSCHPVVRAMINSKITRSGAIALNSL